MAGKLFPLPKFHFEVSLLDTTIPFKEVSGLTQEYESVEYREGNQGQRYTIKRLGMIKATPITLKKGLYSADKRVSSIITTEYLENFKFSPLDNQLKTCTIKLLNEKQNAKVEWTLTDVIPTKLVFSDLASDSSDIMIEEIELTYGTLKTKFI